MVIKEKIDLIFQDPNVNSDKFYVAELQENKGKFTVFVRWGRNGTAGQSGFKCQAVSYEVAKKAYDRVVSEKTGKGYQSSGDNKIMEISTPPEVLVQKVAPINPTPGVDLTSGLTKRKIVWKDEPAQSPTTVNSLMLPQLLNEIEESEIEKYINDPDYCAQEKHNGRRRLLHFESGAVTGYNKKGKPVVFPAAIAAECKRVAKESGKTKITFDGEEIGETYHIFNILHLDDQDLRDTPYRYRLDGLNELRKRLKSSCFKIVETAYTKEEKRALYNRLKATGKEGIVFKKLSGKHKIGYSDDQRKFKFYATASVIVTKHNIKNSVAMAVMDGSKQIPVGNVTMIGHKRPPVGSIIEVSYLYFFPGGSLYQPSYLGVRDDMDASDCALSKLKVKAVEEE